MMPFLFLLIFTLIILKLCAFSFMASVPLALLLCILGFLSFMCVVFVVGVLALALWSGRL